jgi:hypothetical protein
MKLVRWAILLLVIVITAEFLREIGTIALRLHMNGGIARSMAEALRNRYPTISCNGSASYREPVICLSVYGVTNRVRQSEIQDWLENFKAEHELSVEICLMWMDTTDSRGDPIISRF